MKGYLNRLRDKGFDLAEHVPFTKRYRIRCSQCQACAINGVACHETGCPNQLRQSRDNRDGYE